MSMVVRICNGDRLCQRMHTRIRKEYPCPPQRSGCQIVNFMLFHRVLYQHPPLVPSRPRTFPLVRRPTQLHHLLRQTKITIIQIKRTPSRITVSGPVMRSTLRMMPLLPHHMMLIQDSVRSHRWLEVSLVTPVPITLMRGAAMSSLLHGTQIRGEAHSEYYSKIKLPKLTCFIY